MNIRTDPLVGGLTLMVDGEGGAVEENTEEEANRARESRGSKRSYTEPRLPPEKTSREKYDQGRGRTLRERSVASSLCEESR
eukprot:766779-Hanusia_phi.AAC.4